MQTLADSAAFWVSAGLVLFVVYLLPTVIGAVRGVNQLALVFVVNLIGAPTGIGWAAALILAFGPRRLPPEIRRRLGSRVPGDSPQLASPWPDATAAA
jgi:Superinfection immunity protein